MIPLKDYLPYNLVVAADRVASIVAQEYGSRFNLTLPQWRVLSVLAADGPLSHQEIATLSTLKPVAISRAAADLQERGLIFRNNGGDRRYRLVELTPEGQVLYSQIVPVALHIEALITSSLSEAERATLGSILIKIREAAEAALPADPNRLTG